METKTMQMINEQDVLGRKFRVYGTWDDPMFLAKDVAEWIEYSKTSQGYYNVSKMLMTVDEDEKVTITIRNSEGRPHEQWFLTENGLYEVLMQSRKPIARQFKKKVKEILKEIRKKGSYTADTSSLNILKNIVAQFEMNEQRLTAIEEGIDDTRAACADMFEHVNKIQDHLDETLLRKPPEGCKNLESIAKDLGLYSRDGIPHAGMAGAIARTCGIRITTHHAQDSRYSVTMVQPVSGMQQLVLFIKPEGQQLMRKWWQENKETSYKVVTYKRRRVDKATGETHMPGDFRDSYYHIAGKKWHLLFGEDAEVISA